MRIGMLTTSYPRHADDVAGAFVRGMARALVARGHEIEVLAPAPGEGAPPRDEGIDVRWISHGPRVFRRTFYGAGVPDNVHDPRTWPGLVTFPAALAVEARSRVASWDAVVSHWALPCALAAGLVRGVRPHLAVLHSGDVHLLHRLPFRARWIELVGASADELLFASNALREKLLGALPPLPRARLAGRSHAFAMGIDPAPETRARRTLRKELGLARFTVLTLGRLVPVKGIEHAIEATRELPEVDLRIAGEGPCRPALERAAHARVRFLGNVTGVAKAELLRAADALLVPSVELASGRTEGTPTAALEAARAGLPIVASASGGLAEVFEHERSALLVRPGDPVALRDAIARLAEDRVLRRRLSRGGRTVGRHHEWPVLAPRIEALLVQG